jgi:tellurite resistance protein TehA-like permease
MDLNSINTVSNSVDLSGFESFGVIMIIVSIVLSIILIAFLIYSTVRKQMAINSILRIDKNIENILKIVSKFDK